MKIDRLPRKILPVLFLMEMCFSVFADPASFQVMSALSTTSSISRNTTGTKTVARTTGSLTAKNERDGRTMETAVIV